MISRNATIVVPAYNEAERITPLLRGLVEHLRRDSQLTVLIVDDGSSLANYEALVEITATLSAGLGPDRLRLHQKPENGGKGSALAVGFLLATTDLVGFVDADGSVSADECAAVLRKLASSPQLTGVLGSRVKMLGRHVDRRWIRHLVGRVFATMVSVLFAIPVYDSQCGCKFFVREQALRVMPAVRSRGWLWDTQLVILLYLMGCELIEMPVAWSEVAGSKVSLLVDPLRMFWELWRFRASLNLRRGTVVTGLQGQEWAEASAPKSSS